MKNFLAEKKERPDCQALIIFLLVIGIFLISSLVYFPQITALTGYYSTVSPFSCGSACSGGYELSGHDAEYCSENPVECYNTIDECGDGSEPQYEYVENITITSQNGNNFTAGDPISIDAYLDCDSDGDQVVFAYHNGSSFRYINHTTCSTSGKAHVYYSSTIDLIEGNHTIRVIIAYKGTYPEFGGDIMCGDEAPAPEWSDTDDVTFLVHGPEDNEAPRVVALSPGEGTVYESQQGLEIDICAEAIDNYLLSTVSANISWENTSEEITLYESEKNIYCESFTDTGTLGRYNISFTADDTSGNVNDSVTTYFIIDQTANITIIEPTQGDLFAYGPVPLNFTIGEGYDADAAFYSIDGNANETITWGRVNASFTQMDSQGEFGENTTSYANLSMSFRPTENMSVRLASISLKRNGSGTPNAQLQIREDNAGAPSGTVLASGNITNSSVSAEEYSFVDVLLDSTAMLEAGTTYWLFLSPNSSGPDYYSWQASDDGLYEEGNYSNNQSLDLLFIAYDNYKFRTAVEGIARGQHIITVYANSTTESSISSAGINFTIDNTAPVLNYVSYSPSTAPGLDPGVAINFSGNVTDDLGVQEVIIQYKKESDSEFQNASTTSPGPDDIYNGSVIPDSEGIWLMRLKAWDSSGNTYESDNLTFNVTYEYSWSKSPASFNTTSSLLNANTTVGNVTITNTGDFALSFNISKTPTSIPSIYFNNTPDNIGIVVNAGQTSQVMVTATGQSIESQQSIGILIDALNESASPDYNYTNFTLVSYVSGPFLDIEIVEYDATVTQGQSRVALTARITNAGNDTANNVYAYWNLPAGWSEKTNLTANYSSLGVGQQETFTRYVNVGTEADTGEQAISIYVNCSEGKGDTDQRAVSVNSSGEEEEELIITRHSGGGGGGGFIPQKNIRMNITMQDEIEIERKASQSIEGRLENTGDSELKNISLALENFPLVHYSIMPAVISLLEANSTASFSLLISIPEYFGSRKQEATLVASAFSDNSLKKFTKSITIIVVTQDKENALACLENATAVLTNMEGSGIRVSGLVSRLSKAKDDYEDSDYPLANSLCNAILAEAGLAITTKSKIEAVKSAYSQIMKEKDIPEAGELVKLSEEAFEREEYSLASQRAGQAELLLSAKEEEEQQTLVYKANSLLENLDVIIPLLVIIIIIGIFAHASTSLKSIEKRVKWLEAGKENIKIRIEESQKKYFIEKIIPARVYEREIEHHRNALASIEKNKSLLEIRRLRIISNRTVLDLERIRAEVEAGRKELQRKYFVSKTIDKGTFKKLMLGLDKSLQLIDRKIALKKEGNEEVKIN